MSSSISIQIDRRRQRALKEIRRIANRGSHPIFSPFDVSSLSGQIYSVKIRSMYGRRVFLAMNLFPRICRPDHPAYKPSDP